MLLAQSLVLECPDFFHQLQLFLIGHNPSINFSFAISGSADSMLFLTDRAFSGSKVLNNVSALTYPEYIFANRYVIMLVQFYWRKNGAQDKQRARDVLDESFTKVI